MYRIGIDLGGTNIAVGLVNDDLQIIQKKSVPTGASRESDEIVADMVALCRKVCEAHGISIAELDGIGIATPGTANHDTGIVVYSSNLPFLQYPLADTIKEWLGASCPVLIENDANVAAWGEVIAGAAKGTKSSIMITLGTGVGGGIILDGKIYSGFNYAGAELGHIVIETDGAQCGCTRRGCWEAYSSATALIRMTKEKIEECMATGRKTVMADTQNVSGRTAFDAMRAGDEAGKEVHDMYIKYLASGLVSIINIFHPEVISIGGGISNEGQSLIDSIIAQIRTEYPSDLPLPDIRIAKLKNDAGIIGAAMLGT